MSQKPVFTAASDTEAEIIRNLLKDAGIESEMSADDGGGMLQSLSFASGVTVTVDEKDFGDAMVVLDAFRKGETALTEDDEP
jgi:hypothetical protein